MDSEKNWYRVLESNGRILDNNYRFKSFDDKRFYEISKEEKRVKVVKGIEMHGNNKKGDKHLIVLGHKDNLEGKYQKLNLEERLILAKESEGFVLAPHPFFLWGIGKNNLKKYKEYVNAAEFNAQIIFSGEGNFIKTLSEFLFFNKKCNNKVKEFCKKEGIPFIANADSNFGEINLAYTLLDNSPTQKDLVNGKEYINYLKSQIKNNSFCILEGNISRTKFLIDYKRVIKEIIKKKFIKFF